MLACTNLARASAAGQHPGRAACACLQLLVVVVMWLLCSPCPGLHLCLTLVRACCRCTRQDLLLDLQLHAGRRSDRARAHSWHLWGEHLLLPVTDACVLGVPVANHIVSPCSVAGAC